MALFLQPSRLYLPLTIFTFCQQLLYSQNTNLVNQMLDVSKATSIQSIATVDDLNSLHFICNAPSDGFYRLYFYSGSVAIGTLFFEIAIHNSNDVEIPIYGNFTAIPSSTNYRKLSSPWTFIKQGTPIYCRINCGNSSTEITRRLEKLVF